MNKQEKINKAKELKAQLESTEKELQSLFLNELEGFLQKNKEISSIRAYVNNHEFNDGDATYFNVGFDSATLIREDEIGEKYEISVGSYRKKPEKDEKLINEYLEIIKSYTELIDFEKLFGSYYENIEISLDEENKLEIKN